MKFGRIATAIFALSGASVSHGQPVPTRPVTTIAVPQLPATRSYNTPAGNAIQIGANIAELIVADLRSSGLFAPLPASQMRAYSRPESTAPLFNDWKKRGAGALLFGFVDPRSDGRLAVGCYVYDVAAGREVGRQGFLVAPADWRRAAHRCADAAFKGITGEQGVFDSRIAYVAETGSRTNLIKRIAVMDWDATNHSYLTPGAVTVLNPHFSPDGETIAFTSFSGRVPQVHLIDLRSEQERPLAPGGMMSFAPTFSPDGKRILFSMANNGNTDLYVADVNGGATYRLTMTPGSDTAASFSPDGRRIVFESDRSGSQQLYVMNSDGTDQRRISFGPAHYGSPAWSPSGDLIAFTRIVGDQMSIGLMTSEGLDEKALTSGVLDEGPSWAPNGQMVLFSRGEPVSGRTKLYSVPLTGGVPRQVPTPQDGSDPSWSGARS